jgi:peptidoglycan/LPS O-acetylase OafA/YrhL
MKFNHMRHLKYRPEIDGLRALAVLSVIVFHAGVSAIPGGFIGVDVFYVISGFLITKIILADLCENKFSFSQFYSRRVKRLLPAALVLVVTTVVFGYFILTPDKYIELAKSAIYASVFMANVWFANNSGYFDQSTEIAPLVHTWSLAVEEQFYLVFPIIVLLLYRMWGIQGVRLGVAILIVGSLSASILFTPTYPNLAFYMLPTRAWELGVGAMLVFLPWRHIQATLFSNIAFAFGLAIILYGVFFISGQDQYPGVYALIPVIGSALLIVSAHSNGSIGNRILSFSPLALVGRFSYSAYLWHWPIVSYYRIYVSERGFVWYEVVLLIVASLGAGYVSWKFVEERFRYLKLPPKMVLGYGASAIMLMVAIPSVVYMAKGFPDRISLDARMITDSDLMWDWRCAEEIRPFESSGKSFCIVGANWDGARVKALMWGDSHSLHWAPVFDQLAKERNISILIAPLTCPPYLNSSFVKEHYPKFPNFTSDCTKKHETAVAWLKHNPDVSLVIMAAAWSGHVRQLYNEEELVNRTSEISMLEKSSEVGKRLSQRALLRTIDSIDAEDRKILLLGDVPRPNRNLNECAFNDFSSLLRSECDEPYDYLDSAEVSEWHKDSDDVLDSIAKRRDSVTVIFPFPAFCSGERCPTYLNGELLYKDSNHIRRNLKADTLKVIGSRMGLPAFLDGL